MRLPRYSVRILPVTAAIIAAVLGAWSFQRLSQQRSAVAAMQRKAEREIAEPSDSLAKRVSLAQEKPSPPRKVGDRLPPEKPRRKLRRRRSLTGGWLNWMPSSRNSRARSKRQE
jgi:hypothetical protein